MDIPHLMVIWFVSCVWILWTILLWTFMHKFLCEHVFLVGIPRGGITLTYGMSIFNFLRNCQTVLYNCTILYSHPQCMWFQFLWIFTNSCCFVSLFCWIDILIDVKWYHTVVLVFISLMMNDVKQLLVCSWVMCVSSLEQCHFKSFAHFVIGLFPILL